MPGIWHPDAWIVAGPEWKLGYPGFSTRYDRGAVFHSMEGPMTVALGMLRGVAPVSWHFSVPKRGDSFYQHYPVYKITWANGGPIANRRYPSIEHEGMVGEPLTEHQVECDVAIVTWLFDNDVLPWPGFILEDTIWLHSQMTRFGSAPTACPSNRVPLQEVIDMAMLFQEMKGRLKALEDYRRLTQAVLNDHELRQKVDDGYRPIVQAVLDDHEERIKRLEPAAPK
jgi:hypothetical protein